MIKLVNIYHFRSRNTKSGPRPGESQASRLKPISRPLFVYLGKVYVSKVTLSLWCVEWFVLHNMVEYDYE